MLYNKREVRKVNDKKVLHKVKKQWVVLSAFALALLGAGVIATTNVQADPVSANDEQPKTSNVTPNNNKKNLSTQPTKPNTQSIMNQAKQMTSTLMANAGQKASRAQNSNASNANQTKSNVASSSNKAASSVASSKNAASGASNSAKQVVSNLASGSKQKVTNKPSSVDNSALKQSVSNSSKKASQAESGSQSTSSQNSQNDKATASSNSVSNGNAMTTVQAKPGLLKDINPRMNLTLAPVINHGSDWIYNSNTNQYMSDKSIPTNDWTTGTYKGLGYKADSKLNAVEFNSGSLNQSPTNFINSSNNDINNAKSIKFNSDATAYNYSDLSNMFAEAPNLVSVDLGMNLYPSKTTNMFAGDKNLQRVTIEPNFNTGLLNNTSNMFNNDGRNITFNLKTKLTPSSSDIFGNLNAFDSTGNSYYPSDSSTLNGIYTLKPQQYDMVTLQFNIFNKSGQIVNHYDEKSRGSDGGSDFAIIPSQYDNYEFKNGTSSDFKYVPNGHYMFYLVPKDPNKGNYAGLSYTYNPDNNSVNFSDGSLKYISSDINNSDIDNDEGGFISNLPSRIKNATSFIFSSDITIPDKITDLSGMFKDDAQLKNITLNFDTSNVSDMSKLFSGDTSLSDVTLGSDFADTQISDMSDMFTHDNNIKKLDIQSSDVKFNSDSRLSTKLYKQFTNKDDEGQYLTANDPTEFTQKQQGTFVSPKNVAPNMVSDVIQFVSGNSTIPLSKSRMIIKGNPNTPYQITSKDLPSGYVLNDNSLSNGNTIMFGDQNNRLIIIKIAPISNYDGLNYNFDKNNNTVTFTQGTIDKSDLSDFISQAPDFIKNANVLTFNSDINTNNVSDMHNMLASDNNLREVNFNQDTSNASNMQNLFKNDSNLQNVSLGNKASITNSDDTSQLFQGDDNLNHIIINSSNVLLSKNSGLTKPFYKQLNKQDKNGHNYTDLNSIDFTTNQMGTFTTTKNPQPLDVDTIIFNNKQGKTIDTVKVQGQDKSNYNLVQSNVPSDYTLDNSKGTSFTFNNGQHTFVIAPSIKSPYYDGLKYTYDSDTNAITFTGGSVNQESLNGFIQNSPKFIKNANIITFNSDVDFSQVSDMGYMFTSDNKLHEVNFENNTSNVTDMQNMFTNDPKLRNVLFGYNFSTQSINDVSDMNGMFSNDPNLKQIINASPTTIFRGDLGTSPIPASTQNSQPTEAHMLGASQNATETPFIMLNEANSPQSDLTDLADGKNHQGIYLKSGMESDGTQTPYNLQALPNLEQDPTAYTKHMYRNIPDAVYNPEWGKTHNSDASIHIFYTYNSDFKRTQPLQWSDMPTQYQPQNMPNRSKDDYKIIGTYDHYTGEHQNGFNGQGVIGYQLAIGVGPSHPFGNELLRFTPKNIQGYIFHPSSDEINKSFDPYNTQAYSESDGSNGFKEHNWELTSQTNPYLPSNQDGDAYILDYNPTAKGNQFNLDHDTLDITLNYENYRDTIKYSYTNPNNNKTYYWSDLNSDSRNDKNVNSDYDHPFANFYNDVKNHGTFDDIPTSNDFPYGLYVTPSDKDRFLNSVDTSFQYGRNHIVIPLSMPSTITVNYIKYGQYPSMNNQSDNYNGESNENKVVGGYTTNPEEANTPFTDNIEHNIPSGYTLLNNNYDHIKTFTSNHQVINVPVINNSDNTVTYTDEKGNLINTYTESGEHYFSDYDLQNNFRKALTNYNWNTPQTDYYKLHFIYHLPSGYRIDFNNPEAKQALNTLQHSNFDYGKVHVKLPIYPVGTIKVNYITKDKNGNNQLVKSTPVTTQKPGTPFKIDDYLDTIPNGYEYAGISIAKDIFGNVVNPQFDYTKYDHSDHIINILLTKIPSRKQVTRSTITVNYLDKSNHDKFISKAGSDTENDGTDFDIGKYLSNLPNGYEYADVKTPTSDENFDGTFFDNKNHTIDVLLTKVSAPKVAQSTITVNYLDKATGQKVSPSKSNTENVSTDFDIGDYLSQLPSGYEYVGIKNANSNDDFNGTEFDYNNHTIDVLLTKVPTSKVAKSTITVNYLDKSTGQQVSPSKSDTESVSTPFDIEQYLSNLPSDYQYAGVKNANSNDDFNGTEFDYNDHTIDVLLTKLPQGTITVNYVDKANHQVLAQAKPVTNQVGQSFDIGNYLNDLPTGYEYAGMNGNTNYFEKGNQTVNILLTKKPTAKVAKSTITVSYLDKATGQQVSPSKSDTENVSTNFDIGNYLSQLPSGYEYAGIKNANDNDDFNGTEFDYNNHTIDVLLTKVPTPKATKSTITINYIDKNTGKEVSPSKSIISSDGNDFNLKSYVTSLPSDYEYVGNHVVPTSDENFNGTFFDTQNHTIDVLLSHKANPKPIPTNPVTPNQVPSNNSSNSASNVSNNSDNASTSTSTSSNISNDKATTVNPQRHVKSTNANKVDVPTKRQISKDIKDHHITKADATYMNKHQLNVVKKNSHREYSKVMKYRRQIEQNKVTKDLKSGKITSRDVKQMTPKQWRNVKRTNPKIYRKAITIQSKSFVKSAYAKLLNLKRVSPKRYHQVAKSATKLADRINSLKSSRMSRTVIKKISSTATPQQMEYLAIHDPKAYQKILAEQDMLGINHFTSPLARKAESISAQQMMYLKAHNPKLYRKILAEQQMLGISHMTSKSARNYVNGINDARRGLKMLSHNAAYVKGYEAFKRANGGKLPQTGETHRHMSLAAAVMMVLSLTFSIPALKRKKHNE